jgi:hypothetical protein
LSSNGAVPSAPPYAVSPISLCFQTLLTKPKTALAAHAGPRIDLIVLSHTEADHSGLIPAVSTATPAVVWLKVCLAFLQGLTGVRLGGRGGAVLIYLNSDGAGAVVVAYWWWAVGVISLRKRLCAFPRSPSTHSLQGPAQVCMRVYVCVCVCVCVCVLCV